MRLRFATLVSPLLSVLIYGANAEPASIGGSEMYPPTVVPIVNRGNTLLSAGQYNDAARAYSEAIELVPQDYLLYYKRATAYYSMSRHPAALADFDQVLNLTSNTFDKAYLMKARIHAKEGQFHAARDSLKKYTAKNKDDKDIRDVLFGISEAEMAIKKAKQAMKAKLWTACVEAASTALHTASHSVELRQQRANCAIAGGDIEGAVGDLTRLTHITTPDTTLLMKIFRLSYFLLPYSGSGSIAALSALKQCLHYDPDSKLCFPAHKLMKNFDKTFKKLDQAMTNEKWKEIIELLIGTDPATGFAAKFDETLVQNTSQEALSLPSNIPARPGRKISPRREMINRALCKAYTHLKDPMTGERWCEELLHMDGMQDDADGLVGRGEAALKREDWEEATRIFEKAFEASGRSSRDIHQRMQRAQKLLKQSKQKDYYKVLGISRDADTKTIKKAFRKAAMKAHPDKGGSEAKMAAVNEAYEVLSNPELRQRYDNGEDPNDPMAGAGGGYPGGAGGHPFAQFFQGGGGGFPGGSGGFQFHFSPPGFHGY